MKKFVVERNSPEGRILAKTELQVTSKTPSELLHTLEMPHHLIEESLFSLDKVYYTPIIEIDEILKESTRSKNIPINPVPELKAVMPPQPIFL